MYVAFTDKFGYDTGGLEPTYGGYYKHGYKTKFSRLLLRNKIPRMALIPQSSSPLMKKIITGGSNRISRAIY